MRRTRAEPCSGNYPREVPWPLGFPSAVLKSQPWYCTTLWAGISPGAPHLPNEWLPLGGVEEQAPSQAFIKRPVGAMRAGAADARILGMEQRVSDTPGRPWPLPLARPVRFTEENPGRVSQSPRTAAVSPQGEEKLVFNTLRHVF